MHHIFILLISFTISFASIDTIESFQADFIQSVTDEKNKVLTYNGTIAASKPQNALWKYTKPIKKEIYINEFDVTVVEPEIEQVIIRRVEFNIDFFKIIKNAKMIKEDLYEAVYRETRFTITSKNGLIESINYLDDFENSVKIVFDNQKQNEEIDANIFIPSYPVEFDIIRD